MNESLPEPRAFRYCDIAVDDQVEREYVISPEVSGHFLAAFGDYSPIHVDDAYARACDFPRRVAHGAILNGFLSHFVGMYFPGRPGLLLSVDIRFAQPCHEGDTVLLKAVVAQKLDARSVIVIDLLFNNVTQNRIAARGRAQVMLREEP